MTFINEENAELSVENINIIRANNSDKDEAKEQETMGIKS
jgi:hypothetical protein